MKLSATREPDVSTTLSNAKPLVNGRVGVIRELCQILARPGEPKLFHYFAKLANTEEWSGYQNLESGTGFDGGNSLSWRRDRAMLGAIGEAVERYAAGLLGRTEMLYAAPWREISSYAVHPEQIARASLDELDKPSCPIFELEEDSVYDWTTAYSLSERKDKLVPSCMVFLPYFPRHHGEKFIVENSSGLAVGPTLEGAILRGLYEILERDAFFATWLNMSPTVAYEGAISIETRLLIESLNSIGTSVIVRLLVSDYGVPVAIAILHDSTGKGPSMTMGACASLNMEAAVSKAVLEGEQCRRWATWAGDAEKLKVPVGDWSQTVKTRDQHIGLYTLPQARHLASFLWENTLPIGAHTYATPLGGTHTPLDELEHIVNLLATSGHEVLAVDLTTPELRDTELHCVRVLVTDTQPLYYGPHLHFLGSPRLMKLRNLYGSSYVKPSNAEFNLAPHPFP